MKRHKSLVSLSHDHHHGLVQARRLSQLTAETDPASRSELAKQVIGFWRGELQHHFCVEEEVLLPDFSRVAGSRRPEIIETLVQHVELRRRIDDLTRALETAGGPDTTQLIELGRLLHEHIRYEEDVVFPAIEAALDEEQLVRLAERLRSRGVN